QHMAKISHMVLPVSDVGQSRDWYVNKLGFQLDRERGGVVGIKDQSGHGKHQELASLGVKFVSPPQRQFWGYGAEVLDPDGYVNHLWDEVTMRKAVRETDKP